MQTMYFTTSTSPRHARQYRENAQASVYFFDPNLFQGLLLRGKTEVSTRQEWRDGIWRDDDNLYYSLGPADADSSRMLFTADNGRWYENFATRAFPV